MSISEQFHKDMRSLLESAQKTLDNYGELEELHKKGIKDDASINKDRELTAAFISNLSVLKNVIEQIWKVDSSTIINDL